MEKIKEIFKEVYTNIFIDDIEDTIRFVVGTCLIILAVMLLIVAFVLAVDGSFTFTDWILYSLQAWGSGFIMVCIFMLGIEFVKEL